MKDKKLRKYLFDGIDDIDDINSEFSLDRLRENLSILSDCNVRRIVKEVLKEALTERKETETPNHRPDDIWAYEHLPSILDRLKAIEDYLGIKIRVKKNIEEVLVEKKKK